jgi:hypothetical protein
MDRLLNRRTFPGACTRAAAGIGLSSLAALA